MILLTCPHCGPRGISEFTYRGDATVARPTAPESVDDTSWVEYLHLRDNHKGPHDELWHHVQGCRRWLRVRRDVVTHKVISCCDLAGDPAGDVAESNP